MCRSFQASSSDGKSLGCCFDVIVWTTLAIIWQGAFQDFMLENVHVGEPFHWVKLPKRALYSSTFMFTRNGVNHLGFTFNPRQMLLSIKSQTISLISFLWKNETYPQNTNSYVGHWIWWFLIHYIISKKWFVGGVKMSNFWLNLR